ncbi:MAG: DUF2752 domain-containing protein [Phycisphaerae bacterium]
MSDEFRKFLNTRYKIIIVFAAFIAVLLAVFVFNPAESKIFPPCPFKTITGFYCPGCGSLRAVHQLMHGHFIEAFRLNPLMVLFTVIMIAIFIAFLIPSEKIKHLRSRFSKMPIALIVLVIIVAYWLLRNLPFYPFTLLSPAQ